MDANLIKDIKAFIEESLSGIQLPDEVQIERRKLLARLNQGPEADEEFSDTPSFIRSQSEGAVGPSTTHSPDPVTSARKCSLSTKDSLLIGGEYAVQSNDKPAVPTTKRPPFSLAHFSVYGPSDNYYSRISDCSDDGSKTPKQSSSRRRSASDSSTSYESYEDGDGGRHGNTNSKNGVVMRKKKGVDEASGGGGKQKKKRKLFKRSLDFSIPNLQLPVNFPRFRRNRAASVGGSRDSVLSIPDSVLTQDASELPLSGWLWVRRSRHKLNWSRRWAQLTGRSLRLFKVKKMENGLPEEGKSKMADDWALYEALITVAEQTSNRPYTMKLEVASGESIYFATDSKEELDNWTQHLLAAIAWLAVNPYVNVGGNRSDRRLSESAMLARSCVSVVTNQSVESTGSTSIYTPYTGSEKSSVSDSHRLRDSVRNMAKQTRRRAHCMMDSLSRKRGGRWLAGQRASVDDVRIGGDRVGSHVFPIYSSMYEGHGEKLAVNSITRAGKLMVRSPELKNTEWLYRYCLLSRGMFSVYKRQEDNQPQICFPLFGCCLLPDLDAVNRCRLVIVQGRQFKIALEARNWCDHGNWLSALSKVTTSVQPPPESDTDDVSTPRAVTLSRTEDQTGEYTNEPSTSCAEDQSSEPLDKLLAMRKLLLSEESHNPTLRDSTTRVSQTLPIVDTARWSYRHSYDNIMDDVSDTFMDGERSGRRSSNLPFRRAFSTEELYSVRKQELSLRVLDNLLVYLRRNLSPSGTDTLTPDGARTDHATADYEVLAVVKTETPEDANDVMDTKRHSVLSNYSTGTELPASDTSQMEPAAYTPGSSGYSATSSSSAYSSAGPQVSRADSGGQYDLATAPIHVQAEIRTLVPTESEVDPDMEDFEATKSELPPLPSRSKKSTRKPNEFESLAARLGRRVCKRASLGRTSALHHVSLNNLFSAQSTGDVRRKSVAFSPQLGTCKSNLLPAKSSEMVSRISALDSPLKESTSITSVAHLFSNMRQRFRRRKDTNARFVSDPATVKAARRRLTSDVPSDKIAEQTESRGELGTVAQMGRFASVSMGDVRTAALTQPIKTSSSASALEIPSHLVERLFTLAREHSHLYRPTTVTSDDYEMVAHDPPKSRNSEITPSKIQGAHEVTSSSGVTSAEIPTSRKTILSESTRSLTSPLQPEITEMTSSKPPIPLSRTMSASQAIQKTASDVSLGRANSLPSHLKKVPPPIPPKPSLLPKVPSVSALPSPQQVKERPISQEIHESLDVLDSVLEQHEVASHSHTALSNVVDPNSRQNLIVTAIE